MTLLAHVLFFLTFVQSSIETDPYLSEYLPMGQRLLQADTEPSADEYLPGSHSLQTVLAPGK